MKKIILIIVTILCVGLGVFLLLTQTKDGNEGYVESTEITTEQVQQLPIIEQPIIENTPIVYPEQSIDSMDGEDVSDFEFNDDYFNVFQMSTISIEGNTISIQPDSVLPLENNEDAVVKSTGNCVLLDAYDNIAYWNCVGESFDIIQMTVYEKSDSLNKSTIRLEHLNFLQKDGWVQLGKTLPIGTEVEIGVGLADPIAMFGEGTIDYSINGAYQLLCDTAVITDIGIGYFVLSYDMLNETYTGLLTVNTNFNVIKLTLKDAESHEYIIKYLLDIINNGVSYGWVN